MSPVDWRHAEAYSARLRTLLLLPMVDTVLTSLIASNTTDEASLAKNFTGGSNPRCVGILYMDVMNGLWVVELL